MKTLTIISPEEADQLLNWCKTIKLETELFRGKPTCRRKRWWGNEGEYWFGKSHIFPQQPIENDPILKNLRDRFKPEANCCLLYCYEKGASIGEHLDKKCFDKWVKLINLVDSDRDLFGNKETTRFRWMGQNYELQHGEVIEFDSRILHSVPPVQAARYSIQFRQIIQ